MDLIDFEVSPVDRKLMTQLAETAFTEAAHNVVLVTTYRTSAPFGVASMRAITRLLRVQDFAA